LERLPKRIRDDEIQVFTAMRAVILGNKNQGIP
jgi:hypothetical protein